MKESVRYYNQFKRECKVSHICSLTRNTEINLQMDTKLAKLIVSIGDNQLLSLGHEELFALPSISTSSLLCLQPCKIA